MNVIHRGKFQIPEYLHWFMSIEKAPTCLQTDELRERGLTSTGAIDLLMHHHMPMAMKLLDPVRSSKDSWNQLLRSFVSLRSLGRGSLPGYNGRQITISG